MEKIAHSSTSLLWSFVSLPQRERGKKGSRSLWGREMKYPGNEVADSQPAPVVPQ